MPNFTEMMSDTDVSLDAVAKINEMIDQSGRMPMLLAVAHFFGWAEKDLGGPLKVSMEDWNGFARAMNGIKIIRLHSMLQIAQLQQARFTLNGGSGQYEF